MRRHTLAATAAFLCLAAGAIIVVAVESADPPPKEYEPSGLSTSDASKLTGEKRELWEQSKREYDEAIAQGPPHPLEP